MHRHRTSNNQCTTLSIFPSTKIMNWQAEHYHPLMIRGSNSDRIQLSIQSLRGSVKWYQTYLREWKHYFVHQPATASHGRGHIRIQSSQRFCLETSAGAHSKVALFTSERLYTPPFDKFCDQTLRTNFQCNDVVVNASCYGASPSGSNLANTHWAPNSFQKRKLVTWPFTRKIAFGVYVIEGKVNTHIQMPLVKWKANTTELIEKLIIHSKAFLNSIQYHWMRRWRSLNDFTAALRDRWNSLVVT